LTICRSLDDAASLAAPVVAYYSNPCTNLMR